MHEFLQQLTAGQLNSVFFISECVFSSFKAFFIRSKMLDQHSFIKHFRACAVAAFNH